MVVVVEDVGPCSASKQGILRGGKSVSGSSHSLESGALDASDKYFNRESTLRTWQGSSK